ncbi:MAG: hypothetical protein P8X91_02205 [Candidatus Bathyarchaeota archaeon]|jgi:hypothetical protein
MFDILQDPLTGLLDGLISGVIAFFVVLLLAFFYRFFTNEKLPTFIGIAFGLGFWGFTGGLIDVFQQPTIGGAIRILTVLIFVVWGVNTGDKISKKVPQKGIEIIKGIRSQNKKFTKIKLPHQRLIFDIALKPRVPNSLKAELSEREFTLPADLPQEAIIERVKRRLITDWGLGDAEIELTQDGKISHFSIAAKEEGLSVILPTGKIAIPIECKILPSNLVIGDFVTIFLENKQVIEKTEVKGIDEKNKVITIFSDPTSLQKIRNSKASLVIALPISVPKPPALSVECEPGVIEEFKTDTILNSLIRVGVDRNAAREIVDRVQCKLYKLDPPVSKPAIKNAIIQELEKENSAASKKFKKSRIWK